jgi:hypothetical protein
MSPSKALANLLLANDSTIGVTHVPGLICYQCTRFVPWQGLTLALSGPHSGVHCSPL